MNQLCRHLLTAGHACRQPAIKGRLYCRHHVVIKRTLAQVQPELSRDGAWTPLPLVFPEDRAALQLNYMVVLQAFNDRRLSPRVADVYLRILRGAAANLKAGPLTDPDTDSAVDRVILTPEGEEISPACVDTPSWDRRAEPADEAPDALIGQHHKNCECGLCPAPPPTAPEASAVVPATAVSEAAPGEKPQPTEQLDQPTNNPEWERKRAQALLVAELAPWDKNDTNSPQARRYQNFVERYETKK